MTNVITQTESPFNEVEELELASELLEITNEEELDQFLGKLLRKAGKAVGGVLKSPVGNALGGLLKGAIKKALPMAGSALGNMLVPGIGGSIGSSLASNAGQMLGLELEGLSNEDREFEVAKQLVRLGGTAVAQAATAATSAAPILAARQALAAAAQQHAPGLLRGNGNGSEHPCNCGQRTSAGRWIRRGEEIVLLGL